MAQARGLRAEYFDETKADANMSKHGVSFDEASTVFDDPLGLTLDDQMHADMEHRFVEPGLSLPGRLLVVIYTERGDCVRIISARVATRTERRQYEEARR